MEELQEKLLSACFASFPPIPWKLSEGTRFDKPILSYLQKYVKDKTFLDRSTGAVLNMQTMRDSVSFKSVPEFLRACDGGCSRVRNALIGYIASLHFLQTHLPMQTGDKIKIPWSFFDAYDLKQKPLVRPSIDYEISASLWNFAAISSMEASSSATSDVVAAAKGFQQAAGVLQFINETCIPRLAQQARAGSGLLTGTVDLTRESCRCMSNLMLGHAQLCAFRRAYDAGSLKPAVLAKLLFAAANFYHNALGLMRTPLLSESVDRTWQDAAARKVGVCRGLAFCLLAGTFDVLQFGDKVGRLEAAAEQLRLAFEQQSSKIRSKATSRQSTGDADVEGFLSVLSMLQSVLDHQRDDNAKVYHGKVPPVSSLLLLTSAEEAKAVVKPFYPQPDFIALSGLVDPFDGLVPAEIKAAVAHFQRLADDALTRIRQRSADRTLQTQQAFRTMSIPGCLEMDGQDRAVPEPLFLQIRSAPSQKTTAAAPGPNNDGAQSLPLSGTTRINEMQSVLIDVKNDVVSLLSEVEKAMQAEESEDAAFCMQHSVAPTSNATSALVPMRTELIQLRARLQEAEKADMTISGKIEKNLSVMSWLETSHESLNEEVARRMAAAKGSTSTAAAAASAGAAPPAAGKFSGWQQIADLVSQDLREIERLTQERSLLLDRLQVFRDGMVDNHELERSLLDRFGVSLSPQTALREAESLFQESELGSDAEKSVSELSDKEQTAVKHIAEELYPSLIRSRTVSPEMQARQAFLSDLQFARTVADQLMQNLTEGIGFYSATQEQARKLKTRVTDFTSIRAAQRHTIAAARAAASPPIGPPAQPPYAAPAPNPYSFNASNRS